MFGVCTKGGPGLNRIVTWFLEFCVVLGNSTRVELRSIVYLCQSSVKHLNRVEPTHNRAYWGLPLLSSPYLVSYMKSIQ